jgi:hypothetical protein
MIDAIAGLWAHAAHFLSQPFSSQGLFYPFLFTRLQIEGMLFYVLNYIFLLNLALETPERAFERLPFIQYYLCQSEHLLDNEGDKLLSGETTVKVQIFQPFSTPGGLLLPGLPFLRYAINCPLALLKSQPSSSLLLLIAGLKLPAHTTLSFLRADARNCTLWIGDFSRRSHRL